MTSSLLLTALMGVAMAQEVLVMTEKNFQDTVDNNANVLVEFYAPWCGHCKKLAPEYDAAALKLKDEDVVLAKVDATEEADLASKFEVRGYPTLIWFKNGKNKEYDGGRSADTIVSWVMKKIGPVLTLLKDSDTVEAFKKKGDAVVIGSFEEDSDDLKAYQGVAEDMDNAFGYITDSALAKDAGVSKVSVFKNFDEGKADFDGDIATGLGDFVNAESVPLVMTWKDNQDKMGKGDAPLLFVGHNGQALGTVTELVKKTAKDYKGQYLFYTVDTTHGANSRLLDFFGLKDDQAVIFSQEDRKKFVLSTGLDGLTDFIKGVQAGTVEPMFKSEEIPANNDKPVTVLVGKNFDDIVKDSSKDVLVEFYAPWCGHCKKLAPIFDKLGEHYAKDSNIVIAKMDATANEVPEPQVRGFPTIFFFPSDNKAGVTYEAGRELNDFIKYIDANRKTSAAAAAAEGHEEL